MATFRKRNNQQLPLMAKPAMLHHNLDAMLVVWCGRKRERK